MTALVRAGELPTFSAAPDILKQRDDLLAECREVTDIEDQMAADCAARVLADSTGFLRSVEKSRAEVKAPVLEVERGIEAVARSITGSLAVEVKRLEPLLGRWLEQQRLVQAAVAAKAREAEAAAIAAAAQVPEPEQAAQAIRAAVRQTNAVVAAAAPPKIAGTGLRQKVEIDVFNPAALYVARPDLVELKPRLAAIKEALVTNPNLPGVRVSTAPVATVRTTHA